MHLLSSRNFWKYGIFLVGLAAVVGMAFLGEKQLWWLFFVAAGVWVLGSVVQEVVVKEFQPWLRSEVGFGLHLVHLMGGWNHEARICVFVPCRFRPHHLRQLTPYARSGDWSSKRRGLSVTSGAVGRAFRTGEMVFQILPETANFDQEMRREWSFTSDDLRRMQKDRRTFFAIPIVDQHNRPKAVLYCDSSKVESFASIARQQALLKVAVELAKIL